MSKLIRERLACWKYYVPRVTCLREMAGHWDKEHLHNDTRGREAEEAVAK